VTPSGRTFPALICGDDVLTWSNIIAICPPITSTSACEFPLYGTCSSRMPACRLNSSAAMCPVEPLPDDP
jgi:hypothetical protein